MAPWVPCSSDKGAGTWIWSLRNWVPWICGHRIDVTLYSAISPYPPHFFKHLKAYFPFCSSETHFCTVMGITTFFTSFHTLCIRRMARCVAHTPPAPPWEREVGTVILVSSRHSLRNCCLQGDCWCHAVYNTWPSEPNLGC